MFVNVINDLAESTKLIWATELKWATESELKNQESALIFLPSLLFVCPPRVRALAVNLRAKLPVCFHFLPKIHYTSILDRLGGHTGSRRFHH